MKLEGAEAFVHFLLLQAVHAADEVEVFFGRQVVDEEAIVDEGTRKGFPVFALADVGPVDGDVAAVGLQQVEDEAEEGGLARTVITHESEHFALVDCIVFYIDGFLFTE